MIPDPIIDEIESGVFVVRDDLVDGGTKRCFLDTFIQHLDHVIYASPAYGAAQVAIAIAAKNHGKEATIFVAKRKIPHARTLEAFANGARIMQVDSGYLSNVHSKAKAFANYSGGFLLPFGLRCQEAVKAISQRAQKVCTTVGTLDEVWCVGGSGVLATALQLGIPAKKYFVVQIGRKLDSKDVGKAEIIQAAERFEQDAKHPPPFSSCSNYDAKGWTYFRERAKGKRLFWNVSK